MQRVLGIDLGAKKTGIAIGQSISKTASPIKIIHKKFDQITFADFSDLIFDWQINWVIIGYPILADNKPHFLHKKIHELQNQIIKQFSLPCDLVNEYLTSHQARNWMGVKGRKSSAIDDLAAVVLVEDFLNS